MTIIPAAPHHAPQIYDIEVASFADPWSLDAIYKEITDENSVCFTAWDEVKSVVAGYVTMRHIIDEGHISNIAVSQAYRQHGTGSMLVAALIQEAAVRQMRGVTLEVRPSNHAALALYRRHGFAEEGRRKNFYSHPVEDCIIMWRYLEKCES